MSRGKGITDEHIINCVQRNPGIKQSDLCRQLHAKLGVIVGSAAIVARISRMAEDGTLIKEGAGKGNPVYLHLQGTRGVSVGRKTPVKRPPAGDTKQSIRDELLRHVQQLIACGLEKGDSSLHALTFPGIEGVVNPHSFENQMLET